MQLQLRVVIHYKTYSIHVKCRARQRA